MAVYFVSGSRLGFGAAVFSTAGNLGFALGPVVGSFLVLGFGLHATLGLLPPAALLCLIIFFYRGDFLRREPAVEEKSSKDFNRALQNIPWGSLIAVCLIVTLRSWVYISFLTYLPMFFQAQGIALKTGSLMLTVFLVGGAVAGLYGGHLSDKVGPDIRGLGVDATTDAGEQRLRTGAHSERQHHHGYLDKRHVELAPPRHVPEPRRALGED